MTLFTPDLGVPRPSFPVVLPRWQAPHPDEAPITWKFPPEGEVRARNLLSRGAMRAIYRFNSWKLARIVQLESSLEEQVAQLLDACPTVAAYAEQPVLMQFESSEGAWARHYPDFAVLHRGLPAFLEVKYARDVDSLVLERTRHLISLLAPLGIGYRLVTELDLPCADRLTNAWSLLSRGRSAITDLQALLVHQQARPGASLSALGWGQAATARSLARQILEGRISVDLSRPIGPDTMAYTSEQEEGWLWA